MNGEAVANDVWAPPLRPERRDRADKVAEKIARRILRDIVARSLPLGSKLPSEALMLQRYEVGRASLREALRILEVYGLIWIKPGPGGGPVVADVNSVDFGRSATFFYHAVSAPLHSLVESRVYIEPLLARLAAERLTDGTATALRGSLAHEEASLAEPGALELPHDNRFHNVVASMSGNRVLSLFGQSLVDIYIERIRPALTVQHRRRTHDTHKAIAAAILSRHANKAERLMRAHLDDVAGTFCKHFAGFADEIIDWR